MYCTITGWGGEDDDFRMNRLANYTIVRFEPHISRYTMLHHEKALPNPNRFNQIRSLRNKAVKEKISHESNKSSTLGLSSSSDGLSNAQYKLISKEKTPLYTHIIVDF